MKKSMIKISGMAVGTAFGVLAFAGMASADPVPPVKDPKGTTEVGVLPAQVCGAGVTVLAGQVPVDSATKAKDCKNLTSGKDGKTKLGLVPAQVCGSAVTVLGGLIPFNSGQDAGKCSNASSGQGDGDKKNADVAVTPDGTQTTVTTPDATGAVPAVPGAPMRQGR